MVAAVYLSKLSDTFIKPLQISNTSEVYIFQKDGLVLYGPWEELTGKNAFDELESHPFLGSEVIAGLLRTKLEQADTSGTIQVAYPEKFRQVLPLKQRLVAYQRFDVAGDRWLLAVATPKNDALAFMAPFYLRTLGVLIVFFVALIVYFIRLARHLGKIEEHRKHSPLPIATDPSG